ncbi:hypothetical protein FJ872_02065 [Mesorhizobium sp. B2-5-9]|nr:hypothetical protein A9K65_031405 [Mesorhizobium sp. WSM1497]PBC13222.1 hypothetical protein CK225_27830 [Mesorhizobium loti]TPI86285.1 hypothetical protein FJ423_00135 [Mesorhizobium sp. B2-8-9]TPJ29815.1 hypothetical protein FJ425_08285 [Mesorhizobium sp. B2-7-2]TPJ41905.1 hypothetical protein FJ432_12375 [Mesorhizobium sp. B2-6-5]TPJ43697.1 hypothetical protein FJ437_20220 [Mesorhizobium sp. B2-6-6]TPJ64244.1 hypothetical protein FJ462_21855 [Mesorhizobium sp. B2-6-7]TPJ83139.1 hypothe
MADAPSSKRWTKATVAVFAEDRDVVRFGDPSSEAALQLGSDAETPDDARAFAGNRFASACQWPRGFSKFRPSPRRPETGKSSQYAEPVQPRRSAARRITFATHMLIPLLVMSGCQHFDPGYEEWVIHAGSGALVAARPIAALEGALIPHIDGFRVRKVWSRAVATNPEPRPPIAHVDAVRVKNTWSRAVPIHPNGESIGSAVGIMPCTRPAARYCASPCKNPVPPPFKEKIDDR